MTDLKPKRIRPILMGLAVTVAFGLLLESCARTVITLRDDFINSPSPIVFPPDFVASSDLGWERRPNFRGPVREATEQVLREYDDKGFFLADGRQASDPKLAKILVVGDSSVFGFGVPFESSFAELLEKKLTDAAVINLAAKGYSSFQGYKVLLKYAPVLKPQMIIASFNYNDRRYVLQNAIDSDSKFQFYARTLQRQGSVQFVNKIYTARILRSFMRKVGLLKGEDPIVDDVRNLEARVPPAKYREYLSKIAQYGRDMNIPVIFVLLEDNPLMTSQLRKGLEDISKEDYKHAARALHLAISSFFSDMARKYLVELYRKQGFSKEAEEFAKIPKASDAMDGGTPVYLDSDYNSIVLDVARTYNLKIVDPRSALAADPPMYVDFCHPDVEGHGIIASLLYEAVKEIRPQWAGNR